jgi:hypothetical protein
MARTQIDDAPAHNPFANPERSFDFGLTPPGRSRVPALDRVSLVLAIIAPPIGLVTSVVARVLSRRANGWTTRVARSATAVSLILTIALGAGGLVYQELARQAGARARLVAHSEPLCAMIAEHPGILDDSTFGWPALGPTIPASLVLMTEYEKRWQDLIDSAPAGVRPSVVEVANAAKAIVDGITTSRFIDGAGNTAQMRSVVARSTIPAWATDYCVGGRASVATTGDTPGKR